MISVAYVFTAIAALLAIGTIAWQTPWIGLFGSLGGYLPGWLLTLAACGAAAGVIAWSLGSPVPAAIAVILCLLSSAVGVKVIIDQSAALRRAGLTPRPQDFFAPYAVSKAAPDHIVTYGPVDGRTARMGVYLPRSTEAPAPVVVHVHGGGWAAGTETSDTVFVRVLTEAGYLVFTPTYTYAAADAPTWELTPRQIARALVEAKALAEQYGGWGDRIFLTGSSAGGHLAPLVANRLAAGETFDQDPALLPDVTAMALTIPAVDPAFAEGNRYVPAGSTARRLVETFVGGTPEHQPERYASINATGHLSPASPPALLVYGPNDWLVPAQGPLTYALRARQVGVDVSAVPIPWTGHLMGLSGAAGRIAGKLTLDWFAAHGSSATSRS